MTNYLIFGASRGLGAAFSTGLPTSGDKVWLISRSKPAWLIEASQAVNYEWIETDLSQSSCVDQIKQKIREDPVDLLLYNAGIWESTAFTDSYNFEKVDPHENQRIMQVNLLSAIDLVQVLLPNVRKANQGKIIIIGSTSSLPNIGAPEVAYTASKFGLLGLVHSLREVARPDNIAVTCINPGLIATEITLEEEPKELPSYDGRHGMPVSDLVKLVQTIMSLSPHCCVKEVNIPAMRDTHA